MRDIVGTNAWELAESALSRAAVNVGRIAPRAIAFAERLKPT